MKANYWVQDEDLRVIRPLLFVREKTTAQFAEENQLPIIDDNCPACFAAPQERHRIKLLLSSQEFEYPYLFSSLLKTMTPLLSVTTAHREIDDFVDHDQGTRPKKMVSREQVKEHKRANAAATAAAVAAAPPSGATLSEATGRGGRSALIQPSVVAQEEEEDALAEEALTDCGARAGLRLGLPQSNGATASEHSDRASCCRTPADTGRPLSEIPAWLGPLSLGLSFGSLLGAAVTSFLLRKR